MRLVIKTGSATISKKGGGLDKKSVANIADQVAWAHKRGHEVILVSSGAIAAGTGRLHWRERPTQLHAKQAAAAVGQLALMEAYEQAFSRYKIIPAQMLLTREDLADRKRYLNVRHTLLKLLSLKTVPIINENDSVSTAEIQFGDNDALSAAVAVKVEADKLILLSDIPGVLEQRKDGTLTSTVIPVIKKVTPDMQKKASRTKGSKMSVGGIVTKFMAAKMATSAGIETWIASGKNAGAIQNVMTKKPGSGTRFLPRPTTGGPAGRKK